MPLPIRNETVSVLSLSFWDSIRLQVQLLAHGMTVRLWWEDLTGRETIDKSNRGYSKLGKKPSGLRGGERLLWIHSDTGISLFPETDF